jgi:hypothetical protein
MADFSVSPLGQSIKPPASMSLADMVNLARSGQAFQQAQQINPLEVQRARTELSRLQQLMPEELATKIAEREKAETEAGVSEGTSKSRIDTSKSTASSAASTAEQDRLKLFKQKQKLIADSQIALINHPLVIAAEKNPIKGYTEPLLNLIKGRGMSLARDLDIKPDEAVKLLESYFDVVNTDVGAVRGFLKQRHIQMLDDASRTAVLQPSGIGVTSGTQSQVTSMNEFGPVPVGVALPGTSVTMQLMPNESMGLDAANNPIIVTKDSNGQIISIRRADQAGSSVMPSASVQGPPSAAPVAAPPSAAPSVAPAPAKAAPPVGDGSAVAPKQSSLVVKLPAAQTDANLPVYSRVEPPRFPVRDANKPVLSYQLGEKEAQEAGGKFLRESLANRNAIPAFRNNVEKIISSTDRLLEKTITKAGKALTIEQYFDKLIDDSEYKTLSKQLANLQIQMSGTPNMSTDQGKTMASAATGDATYPPEVLQKIAIQLHGEMEAKDKLGTAADRYARKFGENNMASFGQMWNNNADAKVFELISADKLIKDPKIKEKMINEIIGHPKGSEKRQEILNKYRNIKKLINEGTL